MRVYLLSVYGEYGAKQVQATLDPSKLPAMLRSFKEFDGDVTQYELDKLASLLAKGELVDGEDLSEGWGGYQLHIVELQ